MFNSCSALKTDSTFGSGEKMVEIEDENLKKSYLKESPLNESLKLLEKIRKRVFSKRTVFYSPPVLIEPLRKTSNFQNSFKKYV